MSDTHYDVLVIGGGIHGAGVAQASTAAGYRALVLEQGDVASGTSSRSSKLIHGGLRYLEHGQFSLVRECLRERTLLLRNAPKLVHMRSFFIPVYKDSARGRWHIAAGLTLYSLLAGGGKDTWFRRVPRREWAQLDGLSTAGLQAVYEYRDAQTDDAALTRAVMASAQSLGGRLKAQAQFVSACLKNECWEIEYRQHGQEYICTASAIVNAAGSWANDVLKGISPPAESIEVELVQGTHLLLDGVIDRGIYYLESPRDQRPVFAMPWRQQEGESNNECILLGTTETRYTGEPAGVHPLPAEQEYLLETYQHYFSDAPHVRSAFAGLRVLPVGKGQGSDGFAVRPRETVLHTDCFDVPRLLTIYGGKLTAYRATAERVVRMLRHSLPERVPVADTRTLPLQPVD